MTEITELDILTIDLKRQTTPKLCVNNGSSEAQRLFGLQGARDGSKSQPANKTYLFKYHFVFVLLEQILMEYNQ